METLLSIAEQVRSHYLKGYLHCLQEFRSSHTPSAPEILLEIPREGPRAFKMCRVHMGSNSNGHLSVKEVNLETHLEFASFQERGEAEIEVDVSPIAWNGVDFHDRFGSDTTLLEQWALKWLDVEDKNQDTSMVFKA